MLKFFVFAATKELMDSLGRQISRDNYLVDLKYQTFGFSFLQEAADKILIEDATGQKYMTGLFAQQEPYKCVKIDKYGLKSYRYISCTTQILLNVSDKLFISLMLKNILRIE